MDDEAHCVSKINVYWICVELAIRTLSIFFVWGGGGNHTYFVARYFVLACDMYYFGVNGS